MSDRLKTLIGAAADRPLTREEAETAFSILFEGEATPSQIGGLLMALRTRGRNGRRICCRRGSDARQVPSRFGP